MICKDTKFLYLSLCGEGYTQRQRGREGERERERGEMREREMMEGERHIERGGEPRERERDDRGGEREI